MKVQKGDWERMEEYGNLWIGYHRQCASLATYLHVFLVANDGKRIDKRLQKKLDDFVANYHDVKFTYPLDKVFFDGLQDKKRGQYYLEVSWLPTTALAVRSFRPYWEHMSRNRWPYMEYQGEQVSLNTRLFLGYDPVVNLKEIEFNYSPHALDETYHRKQIAFLQSQIVTLEEPVAKWNETVDMLDCMKQHMKKLVPSVSGYDEGILRFLESKD